MRLIILLGAPGVGKGSVSQTLVHNYSFKHFSTGEVIRRKAKETSDIANKGILINDEYINALVLEELGKFEDKDIVILDGFPRTRVQTDFLAKHYKVEAVFYLTHVSDEDITTRLSSRMLCRAKDHSYSLLYYPPKTPGICDFDGSELYRRPDDEPEIVQKRLNVYREQTQPLIDYYRENTSFVDIDANKPVADMAEEISKYLSNNKPT